MGELRKKIIKVIREPIGDIIIGVHQTDDSAEKAEETLLSGLEEFIEQEIEKAREEGRESMIAELSISENMEKTERFFREAPIDYDDKCNLWFDFLSKLTTK